jgi:hypothetical protein
MRNPEGGHMSSQSPTDKLPKRLVPPHKVRRQRATIDEARTAATTTTLDFPLLRHYLTWCSQQGLKPVGTDGSIMLEYFSGRAPHDTMRAFLARRATIELFYELAGLGHIKDDPQLMAFWSAIDDPEYQRVSKGIPDATLHRMVRLCLRNNTPESRARDRLICLMAARGFTPTELGRLETSDIVLSKSYALVKVMARNDFSLTPREIYLGRSPDKYLCVVNALEEWLELWSGPKLFCHVDRWGHVFETPLKGSTFFAVTSNYLERAVAKIVTA